MADQIETKPKRRYDSRAGKLAHARPSAKL